MRKNFELTTEQFDKILKSSQPVRYMIFGGQEPRSPQENANAAWAVLGKELGFNSMTVKPLNNGNSRMFSAEMTPPEEKT